MRFVYETHMHTCQGSACGTSTGSEHARYYNEMGYTGIIITDHFFGGNTAVDRSLPWKERIEQFCSGYEDALAEGQKIGLDVFFGWEQGYGDDEYLVYGLDKAWLLAHPEVEHWTRAEQLENVHRDGGCVIQAHPFRMRTYYMHHIRLGERFSDGCEVANFGNNPWDDARAYRWAKAHDRVMTAGSDNHRSPAKELFGIELPERMTDIHDLVRIILEKKPIGLHVPESRFEINSDTPAAEELWPAEDLTAEEKLIPNGKNWLYDV